VFNRDLSINNLRVKYQGPALVNEQNIINKVKPYVILLHHDKQQGRIINSIENI